MVIVTLGALKVYTVTGYDINCQDSLKISVCNPLLLFNISFIQDQCECWQIFPSRIRLQYLVITNWLLQIEGNLPPRAVFGSQQATLNPAYDSRCLSPSANHAVNRALSLGQLGGNISAICFSVTDECGGCTCAGGRNTSLQLCSVLCSRWSSADTPLVMSIRCLKMLIEWWLLSPTLG